MNAATRHAAEAAGESMPGGRFPIRNSHDLSNAVKDWNRIGKPADVAAWIRKRARELGVTIADTDNGSPAARARVNRAS